MAKDKPATKKQMNQFNAMKKSGEIPKWVQLETYTMGEVGKAINPKTWEKYNMYEIERESFLDDESGLSELRRNFARDMSHAQGYEDEEADVAYKFNQAEFEANKRRKKLEKENPMKSWKEI